MPPDWLLMPLMSLPWLLLLLEVREGAITPRFGEKRLPFKCELLFFLLLLLLLMLLLLLLTLLFEPPQVVGTMVEDNDKDDEEEE